MTAFDPSPTPSWCSLEPSGPSTQEPRVAQRIEALLTDMNEPLLEPAPAIPAGM